MIEDKCNLFTIDKKKITLKCKVQLGVKDLNGYNLL